MATLTIKLSIATFFNPTLEDDLVVIDGLAAASKQLTSNFFGFTETHPTASVGLRLKIWKHVSAEEISPGNEKHAETQFSSDSHGYGIETAAVARQNLFPIIAANRYRSSRYCATSFTANLIQVLRRILRRIHDLNASTLSLNGETYITFPDRSSTSFSFLFNRRNSRELLFHLFCEYCA